MKKEIWFEKGFGTYWPCHWKGWAVMAAAFIPATVSGFALDAISRMLMRPDLSEYSVFSVVPFVVMGWLVAQRHS